MNALRSIFRSFKTIQPGTVWAFVFLILCATIPAQIISIHSITKERQPGGDNGYTLDGNWMDDARTKLLNPINFGPSGTYTKSIEITDSYNLSGSLESVSGIPKQTIFFYGAFNALDPSIEAFTLGEVDALYNWSKAGGKVILCAGQKASDLYNSEIMNKKWGFDFTLSNPSTLMANLEGSSTDIFAGPFGKVNGAIQGGTSQGYFSTLPQNIKVFAIDDKKGHPTLYMDCNTLDLIVADVDAFTTFGGISAGPDITEPFANQDKFWANTIVFMDKLQQPPKLLHNSGDLSVNTGYNSYQWYHNDEPVGENMPAYTAVSDGTFYVEVTVNGGCKVKSSLLINPTNSPDTMSYVDCDIFVPSAFSPDQNRINDKACVYATCIKEMEFSIYNRWGEIVFRTKDRDKCWDGYHNGEKVNTGVFAWTLKAKLTSGKQVIKKGNITAVY